MKTTPEVVRCAKAIRAELRKTFRGTKFSITSRTFSMGNSVEISWTQGVATEEVLKLVEKYKEGRFNGMTDSYERSPDNGQPRAMFITCHRYTE